MAYTLEEYRVGVEEWGQQARGGNLREASWSICRWGSRVHQKTIHALAAAALGPGRFVDLGCGTGDLLDQCPDRRLEYRGIDPVENMIGLARQWHPGVRFDVRTMEDEPSGSEEGVVCLGLLPAWPLFPHLMRIARTWVVADFYIEGAYTLPDGWRARSVGSHDGRAVVRFDPVEK